VISRKFFEALGSAHPNDGLLRIGTSGVCRLTLECKFGLRKLEPITQTLDDHATLWTEKGFLARLVWREER
jgi:hypothetical protein